MMEESGVSSECNGAAERLPRVCESRCRPSWCWRGCAGSQRFPDGSWRYVVCSPRHYPRRLPNGFTTDCSSHKIPANTAAEDQRRYLHEHRTRNPSVTPETGDWRLRSPSRRSCKVRECPCQRGRAPHARHFPAESLLISLPKPSRLDLWLTGEHS